MDIKSQYCSMEQAKELQRLGVVYESAHFYYNDLGGFVDGKGPKQWGNYPAFSVAELFKMLPVIIRYNGHEYFMSFCHSQFGYRVIYETQKLDLAFNIDGDLDRIKEALFGTFRSGRLAAHVLAEYLRMLLDSNSGVLPVDLVNDKLKPL